MTEDKTGINGPRKGILLVLYGLGDRGRGLVIGITGDHSTDSHSGRHVGDPVPSLLYAPQGRRDGCRQFGEIDCATGGLGRVSGTGFLCALLDSMGRLHKFREAHAMYYAPPGALSRMRG